MEKRPLLVRSEIEILDVFLKQLYKESFEDSKSN